MKQSKGTGGRARTGSRAELDRQDRELLAAVQRDNTRPLRELAEHVHLSKPAVARRLQRLRDDGVIAREVSILDPARVGRPLTLVVNICVHSERPADLDAMRRRLAACPQVLQCFYVTGDVDFVAIFTVQDMEEYEALTRELFNAASNVRHFKTMVALQRVKNETALPL